MEMGMKILGPAGVILLLVLLLAGVIGYHRGFARIVLSFAGSLAAIVILIFLGQPLKSLVTAVTPLDEKLLAKTEAVLEEKTAGSEGSLEEILQSYSLPQNVIEKIVEGGTALFEEKRHRAAEVISELLFSAGFYVTAYILIRILFLILEHTADLITRIPVLHQMNGTAGMALEIGKVLILLNVFFLLLMAFSGAAWTGWVFRQIRGSALASWVYDHNFLMMYISFKFGA